MRYMMMFAECYQCHKLFASNPSLVPTVRDANGVKQPLCADCVSRIQALQRERNLPVWPDPLPGAYEAQDTFGDSGSEDYELD